MVERELGGAEARGATASVELAGADHGAAAVASAGGWRKEDRRVAVRTHCVGSGIRGIQEGIGGRENNGRGVCGGCKEIGGGNGG